MVEGNLCGSPLSNSTSMKTSSEATSGICNLSAIVQGLQWENVAILQTDTVSVIDIPQLNSLGISIQIYTVKPLNVPEILGHLHRTMFPDINVILAVDARYLTDFIMKVDRFDEYSNHSTDFRHHSKWLIICNDLSFLTVEKRILYLENVAVIYTRREAPKAEAHLTLQRHPHGNVFTHLSCCQNDISLCYFPNTQYRYNNRRLRVMMLPSSIHVRKRRINGTTSYTGYAPDILEIIAKTLNFSYTISEPPDRSWGLLVNGTWNGITGYLHRKEMDLAACDLTIHQDRALVVDYVYPPIKTDGTTIIYKKRQQIPLFLLTKPLQSEVYIAILAATVVVFLMFKCVERRKIVELDMRKVNILKWFHTSCVTNPVGKALVRQGSQNSPQTTAGRILMSSWWLFVIIMTSLYTGDLVASFSTREDVQPFSNTEELLESNYGVGMKMNGITHEILKNADRPILKRLWKRILQQEQYTLLKREHLHKVKTENYAFLTYQSSVDMYMADDCDLDSLREYYSWEQLAFAVPKQSPMKTDIERVMSGLQESGILDVLWRKWSKSRNSTMCVSERKVKPISLQAVRGGGIIVCVGVLLAGIALVCEKLKYMFR